MERMCLTPGTRTAHGHRPTALAGTHVARQRGKHAKGYSERDMGQGRRARAARVQQSCMGRERGRENGTRARSRRCVQCTRGQGALSGEGKAREDCEQEGRSRRGGGGRRKAEAAAVRAVGRARGRERRGCASRSIPKQPGGARGEAVDVDGAACVHGGGTRGCCGSRPQLQRRPRVLGGGVGTLVRGVGGGAKLGDGVHVACADLNLDLVAESGQADGEVEALVRVWLGARDVVVLEGDAAWAREAAEIPAEVQPR
mmetsp:Transcript_1420/g.4332  ORF Transcript_1420/g.4332 Transcript_1420/m.4332 type:complete len:257 (+) Transcript_1420:28-798(+)